jgi:hypothetical protein
LLIRKQDLLKYAFVRGIFALTPLQLYILPRIEPWPVMLLLAKARHVLAMYRNMQVVWFASLAAMKALWPQQLSRTAKRRPAR